jgi:serine/threonine protein kinase
MLRKNPILESSRAIILLIVNVFTLFLWHSHRLRTDGRELHRSRHRKRGRIDAKTTSWGKGVRKSNNTIGKYVIERKLGSGAMGMVYLGYDPNLDRRAAVKVMKAGLDGETLRSRFFLEARSAAKLDHPNIVRVWDLDTDSEDRPYIAMEYIEGEDLKTIIEKRRFLPFEQKLKIIADVSKALNHAHTMGVIHRDIKPGNIRINRKGEPKILDFGLARLESAESIRTRGGPIGTPYYMSPEQWRGFPELDRRSDLFSVGAVLYEFLSYVHPFEGDSVTAIMTRILSEPHVPLNETLPECGSELSNIVDRALAKEPEERFSTCLEFADALVTVRSRVESLCGALRNRIDQLQAELDHCQQKATELELAELLSPSLLKKDRQEVQIGLMHDVPADQMSDFGVLLHHYASLLNQFDVAAEGLRATLPLVQLLRSSHRHFKQGEIDKCKRELAKILTLSPNNSLALRLLEACTQAGDGQRQEEEQHARIRRVLTQAHQAIDQGQFPKALQIIGRILDIDSINSEALALCDLIRQRQAREATRKNRVSPP